MILYYEYTHSYGYVQINVEDMRDLTYESEIGDGSKCNIMEMAASKKEPEV